MKFAVIDIGTNTVLMLVVGSDGGAVHVLRDEHSIARLGEGVDRSGVISEAALQRLLTVLNKYKDIADATAVDSITAIATSAMRDAQNRDEIISRVKNE